MRRLSTPSLESSTKSPRIIHFDNPIGTGCTTETIYAVLLDIRRKVIDLAMSLNADFGPGMVGKGKFRINPDSYRDGCVSLLLSLHKQRK